MNGAANQSNIPGSSVIIRSFVQDDLETIKDLFTSYYEWLNLDLKFQDYDTEFANLPGKYSSDQGGSLFLALSHKHISTSSQEQIFKPIGCIAMRTLNITNDVQSSIRYHLESLEAKESSTFNENTKCCELKRLFVKPSARGMKAGNSLIMATLEEAKKQGYEYAFLDTLPDRMQGACTLYKRFGFEQTIPYYHNPYANKAIFFIKRL